MADEAGGIQEGLRRVYGQAVLERIKTCEFHFLQCANRQRARLHSDKSKEFFTRVTRTLLAAQTSSAYHDAVTELKNFVAKKPSKDQEDFSLLGFNGGTTVGLMSSLRLHAKTHQLQTWLK